MLDTDTKRDSHMAQKEQWLAVKWGRASCKTTSSLPVLANVYRLYRFHVLRSA